MKTIAYIVPYFGKFRADFNAWLLSCKYNPTIDWLIFTDDKSAYDYPSNVKVTYITFEQLVKKIQDNFDFKIYVDTPYRLCDYKVSYGEVFSKELAEYDYWGHCDMDLIFGNIRNFITEEILDTYEKIGFLGHSTIYLNNEFVNIRYRHVLEGRDLCREFYGTRGEENHFFDEIWIHPIYKDLKIPVYEKIVFADVSPMYWNFQLNFQDQVGKKKNQSRIFTWNQGILTSISIVDNEIVQDEYMYIHFLRRPMQLINCDNNAKKLLIIPNKIINVNDFNITNKFIKKASKNRMILYWLSIIKRKWKKMSVKKVYSYFFYRKLAKRNPYTQT